MRTRDYIGCQGIDAAVDVLQLEPVIEAFLFRSIGLIARTRFASLVARAFEILVMTLEALKMKSNEMRCEM